MDTIPIACIVRTLEFLNGPEEQWGSWPDYKKKDSTRWLLCDKTLGKLYGALLSGVPLQDGLGAGQFFQSPPVQANFSVAAQPNDRIHRFLRRGV